MAPSLKDKSQQEWPQDLSFRAFKKFSPVSDEWTYKTVYALRVNQISIQNQRIGLVKLGKILRATFKLSSKLGFHSMSLRELSKESGISMGGLYAYIGSKEELANLIEHVLGIISSDLTELATKDITNPKQRLVALIHSHIYLSEQLQPWFYFVYMEAKSLSNNQKEKAKKTELEFESLIAETIKEGIDSNTFIKIDTSLAASTATAMMQDWHLKRWKYRTRKVTPDEYAQFVINLVLSSISH